MNPIKIGCKKQLPGEVQFYSNTQSTIQKSKNLEKKYNKKRVKFNCRPSGSGTKEQAFKNKRYNASSRTVQSDQSVFDEYDFASSSINILPNEVSIVDHQRICSVRVTTITLIIVILIILAAAIAIGVTISESNYQQSTSGTQAGINNNQNSLSTISTTVVASSVSVGSQNGTPCSSYTTINDPTRNVNQTSVYASCDTGPLFNESNGGSWIRFVGTGGTIISLTQPGANHCGGYLAGSFIGTLPTTVVTVFNGTVCFMTYLSTCLWYSRISVINCGGFYVYFLPPVLACNARYCTE